ncbi:MAG: 3-deoxy-D-manno-octulosonic acid transferase [Flavobacteriaceae bacterium]|nr:3-deoxy-D-manno-octulosonic acid transferase [Flavobacteriaceae bacterium]
MYFLYNIALLISSFLLKIVAVFNSKIKLFMNGREKTFEILRTSISDSDTVIWFHCASLGEFEQARPVIEKIRQAESNLQQYKILVTFFSPSGYEAQKNYTQADVVCYLPLDTKRKTKRFIELANPKVAIFVKYEFWPNLLNELKKNKIKTLLISGIFRNDQVFFRIYGRWMRKTLHNFDHFFVQNKNSKKLLKGIGFEHVTVNGDTRFDRVYDILNRDNTILDIQNFKNNKQVLVAGSTWPEDESLLIQYINNHASVDEKFIIAPHNINAHEIKKLKKSINKETILFSNVNNQNIQNAQVLIVDSIGILTKIYSYANVAYVGGGFKTGLHNILEPATFGVPILIGPKYQKFNEAIELVNEGGCIVINSQIDLNVNLKELFQNEKALSEKGRISKNYVKNNIGATDYILNYLHKQL